VAVFLFLDFPDPAESSRAHLVEKFIVVSVFVPDFDGLAFEGGRYVGVIIGVEGGLVGIFFDRFFMGFVFGGRHCAFIVFEGFVVFGADEDAGGSGDVHVQCEFEVDFIVFLVDFEEQVGSRAVFLLFLLHLFEHVLY